MFDGSRPSECEDLVLLLRKLVKRSKEFKRRKDGDQMEPDWEHIYERLLDDARVYYMCYLTIANPKGLVESFFGADYESKNHCRYKIARFRLMGNVYRWKSDTIAEFKTFRQD